VLHEAFHAARAVAGRTDLTIHGLRHTGAALAAATGATLAELMRRLGHSTPVAAMHYQHATEDRDRAIAEALSEFHAGNVIALRPKEGRTA
jgi:integrase